MLRRAIAGKVYVLLVLVEAELGDPFSVKKLLGEAFLFLTRLSPLEVPLFLSFRKFSRHPCLSMVLAVPQHLGLAQPAFYRVKADAK